MSEDYLEYRTTLDAYCDNDCAELIESGVNEDMPLMGGLSVKTDPRELMLDIQHVTDCALKFQELPRLFKYIDELGRRPVMELLSHFKDYKAMSSCACLKAVPLLDSELRLFEDASGGTNVREAQRARAARLTWMYALITCVREDPEGIQLRKRWSIIREHGQDDVLSEAEWLGLASLHMNSYSSRLSPCREQLLVALPRVKPSSAGAAHKSEPWWSVLRNLFKKKSNSQGSGGSGEAQWGSSDKI